MQSLLRIATRRSRTTSACRQWILLTIQLCPNTINSSQFPLYKGRFWWKIIHISEHVRINLHSSTDIRKLEVCWVLRNPPISQTSLVGPLIRTFCFPSPLNPSLSLLVSHNLSFPILSQKGLVARAERRCLPSQTRTASHTSGSWEGAVKPRSDATSVQVFRTIVCRRSPFADDCPEGRTRER